MTTGVSFPFAHPTEPNAVDTYVGLTREAADAGLSHVWFAQLYDFDAPAMAALAGREVPGIEVATGIVPIFGRHPLAVAAQARTAQAATHGRFTLGLGLSAPFIVESAYGIKWERPITYLREYLEAIRTLLADGEADYQGETLVAKNFLPGALPGADPVPIIVAAMGPQALKVTGELADGTLPYLAAPKVIEQHIVPALTKASGGAKRRVVATVPGVVTANVDEVKATARRQLELYGSIPSYRKVLDQAGVEHAADVAVIGDEETVAAEVERFFDAGATDVVFSNTSLGSAEDRKRTWALLGELARS
ncbi:TIGR03564 family F420-dependent LLM class oxidoreductase [Kibdelosporangium phytohabitans]|uniref:F420-dependent oxidoreductase n=1 Tax=Kibdelosporangium phytohabitans TaxID=860235 RepID=A0A0N9I5Y2_9PSEU|nr:TIGR03564 family F420-dependent LLM class oxidoreductase [Kibdelosporangium phytohabitans]ALG14275.1 F420-dependent oxidoreductase [Kibdelosporangium phytohabitans]MBE1466716.1 F420-dependent oxidoreductase-like protein [Kibdelosporangium phytohabitans]